MNTIANANTRLRQLPYSAFRYGQKLGKVRLIPMEFKYRPDIDGLRAVAVALVVLFHSGLAFPGGFVGVDVFFVISGYLITGLILKEQSKSNFRLSVFWIRRVRRIFPALAFVVLATLIASWFILLPDDYDELAQSVIWQQVFASNIFFWRKTGYFAGQADLKPLLHTWSLAVEEQFYLGFPLLLMALTRFSTRQLVNSSAAVIVALTVVSFFASEWGTYYKPGATFFLLPTRAWELLLGSLICYIPMSFLPRGLVAMLMSLIGIGTLLIVAITYDAQTRFPGAHALLPCLGTALLIVANTSEFTPIGRILAAKPIVFVGLISYSLYLWHWPVLVLQRHLLADTLPISTASRAIAIFMSIVLATLSWRFIETPFRKGIVLGTSKSLLRGCGVLASLLIAGSLFIVGSEGYPPRIPAQALSYAAARKNRAFVHEMSIDNFKESSVPTFGISSGKTKCLIWGDSHAMALVSGLDAACRSRGVTGFQATHSSTAPAIGFVSFRPASLKEQSIAFSEQVVEFVESQHVDTVILAGMWSVYLQKPQFGECLRNTVRRLDEKGIHVAIVSDVAPQAGDVPMMLSMAVRRGEDVTRLGVPVREHAERSSNERRLLESTGAMILDPEPYFVDERGIWRAEFGGKAMYYDGGHLSVEGSLRLQPLFEQFFDFDNEIRNSRRRG